MSLPNLWVAGRVGTMRELTNYVHAYFKHEHDTEEMYVPASKIRALIEQWHNQHGKADMNYLGHVLNCIADLESLLGAERTGEGK